MFLGLDALSLSFVGALILVLNTLQLDQMKHCLAFTGLSATCSYENRALSKDYSSQASFLSRTLCQRVFGLLCKTSQAVLREGVGGCKR